MNRMNVYTTDKIRNVVILGHGGAGKTSLVEAMAYLSGITNRLGNITDGTTLSDYDKEEQKRKFSISTTMAPIIWGDTKVNVLDTPGYFDFVGEVEEAAAAADAAIIVVNGKSGVEVGTQKAWDLCEKYKLPRIFYVSNMDFDNASYRKVVEDLVELYGKKILIIHQQVRANALRDVLRKETENTGDVPEITAATWFIMDDEIAEEGDFRIREESDFFDRVSTGGWDIIISDGSFRKAAGDFGGKTNVSDCSLVPVTMGASVNLQGIMILLDDIISYFPSPADTKIAGVNTKTNEIFEADYNFAKAKSAFIFKTIVDPFIGKYSMIKVASGVIKSDDTLYDVENDSEFRVSKLYVFEGSKPVEVKELMAGDIGAIGKLDAATGDTLSTKATPIKYGKVTVSTPYTYKRYRAKNKGDEDKISQALAKMMQEDLTMKAVNDAENRQTLIYGMGDQHLDIIVSKLLTSDVDSKYKKQSGGHGQYGHVKMRFEASGDLETPYVFEQVVVGGAVPKNYFPAVEKGIQDSVLKGPMAGYPVVGVKATLYDGSYHPVDSSEMAFKTAAIQAFKKGFMEASPVLLEPIASLKVTVPDKFTGDVMGDLNKRRGRVLGMNPDHKGNTIVEADIPMSELYGYSTQLRSMTGGCGDYAYEFARYEQAPSDVQDKEIAARAAETAE